MANKDDEGDIDPTRTRVLNSLLYVCMLFLLSFIKGKRWTVVQLIYHIIICIKAIGIKAVLLTTH